MVSRIQWYDDGELQRQGKTHRHRYPLKLGYNFHAEFSSEHITATCTSTNDGDY